MDNLLFTVRRERLRVDVNVFGRCHILTVRRERLRVDVNVFGRCHMADSLGVIQIWACC